MIILLGPTRYVGEAFKLANEVVGLIEAEDHRRRLARAKRYASYRKNLVR